MSPSDSKKRSRIATVSVNSPARPSSQGVAAQHPPAVMRPVHTSASSQVAARHATAPRDPKQRAARTAEGPSPGPTGRRADAAPSLLKPAASASSRPSAWSWTRYAP
eukprot:CAMPEP_0183345552 /NCGR_PEP_ID=MMETSP0164_2-20130417/10943_1 /TAXON_ID=221442 /ORGANISM="Coccolithus pelagicus ssp braarudi, Strain PLY182g" /LENGTH=106 /DNA_ID=CAMNT_0025516703 /DNA_START=472 /DNA_END=793 /DNA_ORIENTATION=-